MTSIAIYGGSPGCDNDTTPSVVQAIRDLASGKIKKLEFPFGRYHFRPEFASEDFLFISNNDESLKRIAFDLRSLDDVEIDGGGSEFIFHGSLVAFALRECSNVTLKNFTIDTERSYTSEGEILDFREIPGNDSTLDLRIPKQFTYHIEHGRLVFGIEGEKIEALGHLLEFDPVLRQTAYKVGDNAVVGKRYLATQLEDGVVRIEGAFFRPLTRGNTLVMTAGMRYSPGIALLDSENISISDVTIHHCAGMGVIGQRTRNIDLQRIRVTPNLADGRMISTTADAVHFVNCAGQINVDECLFENMMDDPINIHGIYARISKIVSTTVVDVELVHPQQRGINITQLGDTVEFVAKENLLTYHEGKVKSFERFNKQFFRLTTEEPISNQVKQGDSIASLRWIPNATLTNNVSRNNRARGFLISTAGKVLVENNYFHIPGSAILIAGDANYWFESGKVRDVIIRGNHFDRCMFGPWGRSVISINPEIEPKNRSGVAFHRNIVIEGNKFDGPDVNILTGHCVSGLIFRDNVINIENPSDKPVRPVISVEDSTDVEIAMGAYASALR